MIRKIIDESRAGVGYVDVHIGGSESVITGLLPEGILQALEPAMMLPECAIPNNGGAAIFGSITPNGLRTHPWLIYRKLFGTTRRD